MTKFKSTFEINTLYSEHINSLVMSGMDFDEEGLRLEWQWALDEFEKDN